MSSTARKRWLAAHAESERARKRRHYAANKRKERERGLAKRRKALGIPAPSRAAPEWCECCGRVFEKTPNLDHNHHTGAFRGWICAPCNQGMGLLGDSTEGVEKALAYLRRAS